MNALFPEDSADRKEYPVYSGALQYFPSALAAVANHSFKGNEKHNPGQPLHHDRAKSGDEADALMRHLMEGDYVGMAWRALALLQKHLEANGAPIAPGARNAGHASRESMTELARESGRLGLYGMACGVPVESSYLDSFSPNAVQAETLREYGIGDIPATLRDIPARFTDSHGNRITRRDVAHHPMHAEALRLADEKPGDKL